MEKKEPGKPAKPITVDSIVKCSTRKLKSADLDAVREIDEDAQTDLLELTLPGGKALHLQAKNAWVPTANPVHDTFAQKVKKAKPKGGLGIRK